MVVDECSYLSSCSPELLYLLHGHSGDDRVREIQDDEMVMEQASQIISSFQVVPRLVVFDLDYTLWPFYCECRSKGDVPYLYPQAKGILLALKDKKIGMAIASRTPTPDIARVYLDKLGIQSMFDAQEMYHTWSTYKTEHFQKIQRKTQVPYDSMLFYDDEIKNIKAVRELGVVSIQVKGVDLDALQRGLTEFSGKNAGSSDNNSR